MSLDVYLIPEQPPIDKERAIACLRENGFGAFADLAEDITDNRRDVFEGNITHNLNKMANASGIYKHLWRPEEIGFTKAAELVPGLEAGLKLLEDDPQRFKTFNPSNGWGTYEGLVEFVREYLAACRNHPTATIRVSR